MKYFKYLILTTITIIIGVNLSCERDDICPESTITTPKLIIDAYDTLNPDNKKNVSGLLIVGVDNDEALPGYTITSTSSIKLPLRSDANVTQYILIKEATINDNGTPNDTSDDTIDGNYDTITINYLREEVYVSRACGYKTIFNNVNLTIETDSDNWIKSRIPLIEDNIVDNETETHFNIFH